MKTKNNTRQIRRYIKELHAQLPKNYPNKKMHLDNVKRDVSFFLEEHPDAGYDDIICEFGAAQDIASSFIGELSNDEITDNLQNNKKKTIVLVLMSVVCIIAFIYLIQYFLYWKNEEALIVEETLYVFDGTEIPSEWEEITLEGETSDAY